MIFKFNSLQLATSLRAIAVTSFICSTILCSPKLFFTLNVHYCDTMWQMWQECVVKIGNSVKCGKSVLLIVKFSTILCSPTLFFTLNVHYCDTMWQEKSVFSKVAREECVVKCEVQSPAWSGFCCPVESSLSSFRCWWAAPLFFSSDYHVSPRLLFFHPYHVHSLLLLHFSPRPSPPPLL